MGKTDGKKITGLLVFQKFEFNKLPSLTNTFKLRHQEISYNATIGDLIS